jgi:hypothetical protein
MRSLGSGGKIAKEESFGFHTEPIRQTPIRPVLLVLSKTYAGLFRFDKLPGPA